MPIFVDTRGTGETEIYNLLKDKHLAVEHVHVDSGDIVFGDVGIERKTINDLVSSVTGGNRHFWEQLEVLKNTYKHPMVIVEGNINYKDRLIAGILFSLLLGWKIPYISSYNQYDTAEIVEALFLKYGTNKATSYPPCAVRKEYTPKRIKWAMLQCIKGIGPKTADNILKEAPEILGAYLYKAQYLNEVADKTKLNKATKIRFLTLFDTNEEGL